MHVLCNRTCKSRSIILGAGPWSSLARTFKTCAAWFIFCCAACFIVRRDLARSIHAFGSAGSGFCFACYVVFFVHVDLLPAVFQRFAIAASKNDEQELTHEG